MMASAAIDKFDDTSIIEVRIKSGGRYCCVINCSSNSRTIDPRTGKPVKFHSFPNTEAKNLSKDEKKKEKERLAKWVINTRRADLKISNVKSKRICSLHFEPIAYTCPSDIASSRLLPSGIPTLINCPNPPAKLTPSRPFPKKRLPLPPKKRPHSQTVSAPETDSFPLPTSPEPSTSKQSKIDDRLNPCPPEEIPHQATIHKKPCPPEEIPHQATTHDKQPSVEKLQATIKHYQAKIKNLQKQVRRLKASNIAQKSIIKRLVSELDQQQTTNELELPPVTTTDAIVSVSPFEINTVDFL